MLIVCTTLCPLLYVHSGFAIILIGKRELDALLCLSAWCLVIVVWLFLTKPRVCLQFVVVVFPDHTHLLFLFVRDVSAKTNSLEMFSYGPISHVTATMISS